MPGKKVIVEYRERVLPEPSHRGYRAGERFVVRDEDAAHRLHPRAIIVGYADGTPFVSNTKEKMAITDKPAKKASKADAGPEAGPEE